MPTAHDKKARLLESLHSKKSVAGLTHNFYHYPARMLPELARELILQYSRPNDIVLDPFMGGGTSIVEAVASGRRAVGIDVNPLAVFLTYAKTTPLSTQDHQAIQLWASRLDFGGAPNSMGALLNEPRATNLPNQARRIFNQLIDATDFLSYPRQQRFARCCLLRLGQWAVEVRDTFPNRRTLKEQLLVFVDEMLAGLDELVAKGQQHGIPKHQLTQRRTLLLRSAAGADSDKHLSSLLGQPSLVVTSPPYPNVHVLYHRWQVDGRRETSAPYWFIGSNDGRGASYYTLGSRSTFGLENYFRTIAQAYASIRSITGPKSLVVQLLSFSDPATHLPSFLNAMECAGYEEISPFNVSRADLWRTVPNRKWYNRIDAARGAGHEVLLFHKPITEKSRRR
jgi:hypothetical protein